MASFGKSSKNISGKYVKTPPRITGITSSNNYTFTADFSKQTNPVAFQLKAVDGVGRGKTTYRLSNGQLPPGFSLDENTGVIQGSYDGFLKPSVGYGTNQELIYFNKPQMQFNFEVTASSENPAQNLTVGQTSEYTISVNVPFKYRQIVTRNYMAGGYQNSQLWNNVNRCIHATDTTSNLGDSYVQNFHYKSGACSTSKVFIWNGGFVTAFNMRTESRSDSGSVNFNGSNTGTVWDSEFKYAWINGEGSGQTRRWSIATESVQSDRGGGWNSHAAGFAGETRGTWWDNGGYTAYITYATESQSGSASNAGAHGQQKGLSSKNGKGYGGNEGSYSGGYNLRITNDVTGDRITTITKPAANCGEENYGHGQDKGYMLACYDGAQNNRAFILFYATDSGYETGATSQTKGKGGASSGHCGFVD